MLAHHSRRDSATAGRVVAFRAFVLKRFAVGSRDECHLTEHREAGCGMGRCPAGDFSKMKNLTHTEALQIVVEAARAYAEIAADSRKPGSQKKSATEIWQAIETLQTPPLFQPTFKHSKLEIAIMSR
jgi:hypothetical protein